MYWVHIFNLSLIYIILAISLNLILGYGGMASMAHAAFFGIGGYIAALISIHLGYNFLIAILIGMLAVGISGGLIGLPFIRIRDEYVILFTLAFQMVFFHLVMAFYKVTGGDSGLVNIPRPELFSLRFSNSLSYVPLLLVFTIVFFLICWRIINSPFGRVLKGIREDETAILSLGKNVIKFKVQIFMIGTGIAGAAGGLYVYYSVYIAPDIFNLDVSILLIVMVILGGTANLWGSVLGALLLVIIPESLTFIPGAIEIIAPLRLCLFGSLLILFMRFRPEGVIPEYFFLNTRKSKKALLTMTDEGPKNSRRISAQEKGKGKNDFLQGKTILETKNISKRFGGLQAVNDLSVCLKSGQITAIVGPNGCGKTTAFNIITGFLPSDKGSIYFKGKEIANINAHQLPKKGLVRSWQDVRIFQGMTVLDNVLLAKQDQSGEVILNIFFRPCRVRREMNENLNNAMTCLNLVGLEEKALEIARNLAFAEQKLLAIARLLATEAQVILLDEPSSGIDPNSLKKFIELIRNLADMGKTICIVEHNFDVIREMSDYVYFMASGTVIAEGSAEDIISDPKLGKIYFGI